MNYENSSNQINSTKPPFDKIMLYEKTYRLGQLVKTSL